MKSNKHAPRERFRALSDLAVMVLRCPYCAGSVQLTDGGTLYPHRLDLKDKQFYVCQPCFAYVGCHPGSTRPLGRLADATLRRAKSAAHTAFDVRWQSGFTSRKDAYAWLAEKLSMNIDDCHIGMFDVETCQRVVAICRAHPFQFDDADLI